MSVPFPTPASHTDNRKKGSVKESMNFGNPEIMTLSSN